MDCISDWCPWKTSNVSSSKRLWWSLGGIGTGIITIMYRKKSLWVIDARFLMPSKQSSIWKMSRMLKYLKAKIIYVVQLNLYLLTTHITHCQSRC
jgi:hypothetical protein